MPKIALHVLDHRGVVTPMVEVHEGGECSFRYGIDDAPEGTDSTHLMPYIKQVIYRQIRISKPCCMLESFSPQIKSAKASLTVAELSKCE